MRLIWTVGGHRDRLLVHVGILLTIAMACGSKEDPSGETDGTTDGTPATTDTTMMSGGPTTMSTGTPTTTSTGMSTGDGSTGEASTGSASTGEPPVTGSSGEPTDGSASVTGASSSDDGSSGTGVETTGGIMSQACADGCAVEFQCGIQWDSAEECTEHCNANLWAANQFSSFCMQAWEELSACLATLDCTEFEAWQAAQVFPYPCSTEDGALAFECDGQ